MLSRWKMTQMALRHGGHFYNWLPMNVFEILTSFLTSSTGKRVLAGRAASPKVVVRVSCPWKVALMILRVPSSQVIIQKCGSSFSSLPGGSHPAIAGVSSMRENSLQQGIIWAFYNCDYYLPTPGNSHRSSLLEQKGPIKSLFTRQIFISSLSHSFLG